MLNVNPIKINSFSFHGVEVLNIVEVLDALEIQDYGQNWAVLQAWMQEHNLDYYADQREDFNEYIAARQASQDGYWGVVVEDLS